jgi:hypothetical protein
MSLDRFEAHLRDPAPGFRCYAAGDRSKNPTFIAVVENRIGAPGSAEALAAVTEAYPAASPILRRFVELHDGVVLYRDTKSEAAGVRIFPTTEWQAQSREMRESMTAMGFGEVDMPDWFRTGVVFASIPRSGNYFAFQPSGDPAGQVFYCNHDDFGTKPIAASFEEFLHMIESDPPGFLYRRGCYTRYSDGTTRSQWIPKQYIPDCRGG